MFVTSMMFRQSTADPEASRQVAALFSQLGFITGLSLAHRVEQTADHGGNAGLRASSDAESGRERQGDPARVISHFHALFGALSQAQSAQRTGEAGSGVGHTAEGSPTGAPTGTVPVGTVPVEGSVPQSAEGRSSTSDAPPTAETFHWRGTDFGPDMAMFAHLRTAFSQGSFRITPDMFASVPGTGLTEAFQELLQQLRQLNGLGQVPASSSQLDALLDEHSCTFVGEDPEPCPICLDDMASGEMGVRMPCCSNSFHRACALRWLGKESSRCPVCRQILAEVVQKSGAQGAGDESGSETNNLADQTSAELKRRCQERGLDCSHCIEKHELVALLLGERRSSSTGARRSPAPPPTTPVLTPRQEAQGSIPVSDPLSQQGLRREPSPSPEGSNKRRRTDADS